MPAIPITVTEDRHAVKYDGTNSADIEALITDFTVTGETATALSFTSLGVPYTVALNGWVTYWQGAVREAPFANDGDFRDVYRDSDVLLAHVHDLKLVTGLGYVPEETPAP
jgi:hypothetical protein